MSYKALKKFPRACELPTDYKFLNKVLYYFRHWIYYPLDNFYNLYKERISRSLTFAKFGWLNYDFDINYTYKLLEFKLKRLQECLESGHAVQQKDDVTALKELIKIVKRLYTEEYENKYHKEHDKKWGKLLSKTIPNLDENGKIKNYSWKSWRSKLKNASKKNQEKEKLDFLNCFTKGDLDRCKDINRMTEILKKHSRSWWD